MSRSNVLFLYIHKYFFINFSQRKSHKKRGNRGSKSSISAHQSDYQSASSPRIQEGLTSCSMKEMILGKPHRSSRKPPSPEVPSPPIKGDRTIVADRSINSAGDRRSGTARHLKMDSDDSPGTGLVLEKRESIIRDRHLSSGSGSELDDSQRQQRCGHEKPPKPRSSQGGKAKTLRTVHTTHQAVSRRVSDPDSDRPVSRSPRRSRHHSSDSDSASDISSRLKVGR